MSKNKEQFIDISWIDELSVEDASIEEAKRRGLGQRAVLTALGIRGASNEQLFWSEATGRFHTNDELGPIVIESGSADPAVGIAIWRNSQTDKGAPRSLLCMSPRQHSEATPIPQSLLNDDLVRQAMYDALRLTEASAWTATEIIARHELKPLKSIQLSTPIELPTIDGVGTHNAELKKYAFDVYDELVAFFGSRDVWDEWEIVTYYPEGDESARSIYLGLFTQKILNQC